MIKTTINFGGFYESIHDGLIERRTDSYFQDTALENNDNNFEYFDYKKIRASYIKNYCYELEQYIDENYKVKMRFNYVTLYSPEYYNYATDKIDCSIKVKHVMMLTKKFKINLKFLTYLRQATQSYDGFHSFYTYDEALSNKDGMLIDYILSYICKDLNELVQYGMDFDIFLTKEGSKIYKEQEKILKRNLEFESKQLQLQF